MDHTTPKCISELQGSRVLQSALTHCVSLDFDCSVTAIEWQEQCYASGQAAQNVLCLQQPVIVYGSNIRLSEVLYVTGGRC